ncbi:MAG TPA: ATPase [Chloroflexi bacterium]|nr:ATPase [Chloroflexota bacterium]
MRYRDLVQFDPIETVIQVREADRRDEAEHLVRTYVISDRMAEQLIEVILPQLRFDRPADNKGVLIVGNYGTGKSHLMSVVSAVAEHADLVNQLARADVASAIQNGIAGRFQVLRTEIGATRMSLRDILCGHLERFLEQRGIEYRFPGMADAPDSKDLFIAMMHQFAEHYPDQGLLVIVDELLEYLRSRRDQELILDLTFLRELGEVSRLTRFRFIGGVQESLFDSPRFQFVADSVRRVRDRFEQVRITRTDVAFVVAERLLRKTADQRAWIHRYLERFAPLYPAMAERLDEYVRLFPIHPTYLDVFERITLVEKREALRTLSRAIAGRLDETVPDSQPGLIAYDDYWRVLQGDPTLRSVPEVREVVEKSQILEERIQAAYTRPSYRPMALRLIHALSVLRLTTGDVYAPLGATPEELRDGLCLHMPLPEPDPDFLRGTVDVAMKEIIRTVSGQFIAYNPENGQYYLDLKKDIDYEALIAEKARNLSPEQLDRYYFDALKRVMECTDSTHVPGYRIWSHEVSWQGHRVARRGYLFFGAPNERSTAQPPRDFYLYFIQPFEPPHFDDHHASDELFFHLTGRDENFEQLLQTFAGALEMAGISGGEHKQVYLRKADDALSALQRWLRQSMPHAVTVTHQGTSRRLAEWTREAPRHQSDLSIRELVNAVASAVLASVFDDRYPEYPAFRGLRDDITETSRPRMAQEAIRWLAGTRTQAGAAVLDGLELVQDGQVRPRRSRYAGYILDRLAQLRSGEVLNRSALLVTEYPGIERDPRFKLEPEWLVVLLLSLVYSGDVVLQIPGQRIDATTLDQAARLAMETLADFRFIERPRDVPLAAWVAVFEALQLSPGLIRDTERHDVAIETLQREVEAETGRVVRALETLRQGLLLWQEPVLAPGAQAQMGEALGSYKAFLESLRVFNTPGRLRNLRLTENEIQVQAGHRRDLRALERLVEGVAALQPLTAYLRETEAMLPADHPLGERIAVTRAAQLQRLRAAPDAGDLQARQLLQRELESLKGDYVEYYVAAHRRARLDRNEDERKKRILESPRLKRLQTLSRIRLLPEEQLARITNDLRDLVSCWRLVPSDLRQQPVCPHCGFRATEGRPQPNAANLLDRIEADVDRATAGWAQLLLTELDRPGVVATIEMLDTEKKVLLQTFRRTKQLPDMVTDGFVSAINEALRGVERLAVPFEELLLALVGDGTPCPPEVFRQRFGQFLTERLTGHDPERVRISIEW